MCHIPVETVCRRAGGVQTLEDQAENEEGVPDDLRAGGHFKLTGDRDGLLMGNGLEGSADWTIVTLKKDRQFNLVD